MFPDIRLLIATLLASIMALICGFGMFAAIRVSHEPLARLPSPGTPPQLLAGTTAAAPLAYAEPFEHRFPIGEPMTSAELTASLTRMLDRRDGVDAPREKAANIEARHEPALLPMIAPPPAASADNAIPAADKPEPAAVPPAVAGLEPPAEQALPAEPAIPSGEIAPANAAKPAGDADKKNNAAATKTVRRTHTPSRLTRRAPAGVAPYAATGQNSEFAQRGLGSAPQWQEPQAAQQRRARPHHAKVASRKVGEPNAASGGPYVPSAQ